MVVIAIILIRENYSMADSDNQCAVLRKYAEYCNIDFV